MKHNEHNKPAGCELLLEGTLLFFRIFRLLFIERCLRLQFGLRRHLMFLTLHNVILVFYNSIFKFINFICGLHFRNHNLVSKLSIDHTYVTTTATINFAYHTKYIYRRKQYLTALCFELSSPVCNALDLALSFQLFSGLG
jgi:hypothetical protein